LRRAALAAAPDPWILNLARNPDKFFLWGTTNHFNYSFTYDPTQRTNGDLSTARFQPQPFLQLTDTILDTKK
jgi:hypothetical protein